MRIAVFGTGGVGGYFGGRLAQAGEEVIFIARGDHLQALQTQGLQVESIQGDFQIAPAQATDDPNQIGVVDTVIVGVKTWQITEIAPSLRPLIGPNTCVIPLQNGLEAPAQLAEALGPDHVLGGTCAIYSYRSEPGCIRHVGLEPSITIGELGASKQGRTEGLSALFQRAGIQTTVAPDIRLPMWEKFLILRWGLIGALTRAPAEVLRTLPQTREMIQQACEEVIAMANASGVPLPEDLLSRNAAILDSLPASATTSLQRDIMDGYPSELDAQAGVMIRLSGQTDTPAPLHEFLYHSLLPMEMKARNQIHFPD